MQQGYGVGAAFARMDELTDAYETLTVTKSRHSGVARLAGKVSLASRRVVLTKKGHPIAAVIPISDLERLHEMDRESLAEMRNTLLAAARASTAFFD